MTRTALAALAILAFGLMASSPTAQAQEVTPAATATPGAMVVVLNRIDDIDPGFPDPRSETSGAVTAFAGEQSAQRSGSTLQRGCWSWDCRTSPTPAVARGR